MDIPLRRSLQALLQWILSRFRSFQRLSIGSIQTLWALLQRCLSTIRDHPDDSGGGDSLTWRSRTEIQLPEHGARTPIFASHVPRELFKGDEQMASSSTARSDRTNSAGSSSSSVKITVVGPSRHGTLSDTGLLQQRQQDGLDSLFATSTPRGSRPALPHDSDLSFGAELERTLSSVSQQSFRSRVSASRSNVVANATFKDLDPSAKLDPQRRLIRDVRKSKSVVSLIPSTSRHLQANKYPRRPSSLRSIQAHSTIMLDRCDRPFSPEISSAALSRQASAESHSRRSSASHDILPDGPSLSAQGQPPASPSQVEIITRDEIVEERRTVSSQVHGRTSRYSLDIAGRASTGYTSVTVRDTVTATPEGDIAGHTVKGASQWQERTVFPVTPAWSERYVVKRSRSLEDAAYIAEPRCRTYERRMVPPGWKELIHPEGVPYFVDETHRIITDAFIYDENILAEVDLFVAQVLHTAGEAEVPEGAELVLELMPAEASQDIICGYYLVDHSQRSLFWFKEFDAAFIVKDVQGNITPSHFKHKLESEYWLHREYFPALQDVEQTLWQELWSVLTHFRGDVLTSLSSTSLWSHADLDKLISFANDAKGKNEPRNAHAEVIFARLMSEIAKNKFIHYHGEELHRLNSNQSLHGSSHQRTSWLFKIVSFLFLFSGPDVYLRQLDHIFVDHIVKEYTWKDFMSKIVEEWKRLMVLDQVMLAVNINFLSISSAYIPNQAINPSRSLSQISAAVSIMFVLGSFVMGMLLLRQNATQPRETAEDGSQYLERISRTVIGIKTLAILYALPYVLLMWGTLAFIVAFASWCFTNTRLLTRLVVGIPGVLILFLVIWCIWVAWDLDWFSRLFSSLGNTITAIFHLDWKVAVTSLRVQRQNHKVKDATEMSNLDPKQPRTREDDVGHSINQAAFPEGGNDSA